MVTNGTVLASGGPLLFQFYTWESIMKQWVSKLFQFSLWPDPLVLPRDVVNEPKFVIFEILASLYVCRNFNTKNPYFSRANYMIYQVKQLTLSLCCKCCPGVCRMSYRDIAKLRGDQMWNSWCAFVSFNRSHRGSSTFLTCFTVLLCLSIASHSQQWFCFQSWTK